MPSSKDLHDDGVVGGEKASGVEEDRLVAEDGAQAEDEATGQTAGDPPLSDHDGQIRPGGTDREYTDEERADRDDEAIKAHAWRALQTIILKRENQKFKRREKEINFLLVYAGLFSAVAAAFLNSYYTFLQPDHPAATNRYLFHISQQMGSFVQANPFLNSTVPASATDPEAAPIVQALDNPSIKSIAALWFLSLFWSLTAAMYCIVVLICQFACRDWLEGRRHLSYQELKKVEPSTILFYYHSVLFVIHEWGEALWPACCLVCSTCAFVVGLILLYLGSLTGAETFAPWIYVATVAPFAIPLALIGGYSLWCTLLLYFNCTTFTILIFLYPILFPLQWYLGRMAKSFRADSKGVEIIPGPIQPNLPIEFWGLIRLLTSANTDGYPVTRAVPCFLDIPRPSDHPVNRLSVAFSILAAEANMSPIEAYKCLMSDSEHQSPTDAALKTINRRRGGPRIASLLLLLLLSLEVAPVDVPIVETTWTAKIHRAIESLSPFSKYLNPLGQLSSIHITPSQRNILVLSSRMYDYACEFGNSSNVTSVRRDYFAALTQFIRTRPDDGHPDEIILACDQLFTRFGSLQSLPSAYPGAYTTSTTFLVKCAVKLAQSRDHGGEDFVILVELIARHLIAPEKQAHLNLEVFDEFLGVMERHTINAAEHQQHHLPMTDRLKRLAQSENRAVSVSFSPWSHHLATWMKNDSLCTIIDPGHVSLLEKVLGNEEKFDNAKRSYDRTAKAKRECDMNSAPRSTQPAIKNSLLYYLYKDRDSAESSEESESEESD